MNDATASVFSIEQLNTYFSEFNQKITQVMHLLKQSLEINLPETTPVFFDLYKNFVPNVPIDVAQWSALHAQYTQDYYALLQNLNQSFVQTSWAQQPILTFLQDLHELNRDYLNTLLESANLTSQKKNKFQFFIQQFLEASDPHNFIFSNDSVMQKIVETQGKSLLDGLDNFIADLTKDAQHFQIQMTDLQAFSVGKNLAATPGKIIYQSDLMQLIQYEAQTENVFKTPLLIIPPCVNKYYILDLSAQNSMVDFLVKKGHTVFMISWANIDKTQAHKNIDDYIQEGPLAALAAIEEATGEKQVHSLGYCIGGVMLALTLGILAQKQQKKIISATYLTTPFDFSEPGPLQMFLDEETISALMMLMEKSNGLLKGPLLGQVFALLRPKDLIWRYFVDHYLCGNKPAAFDILYWNVDTTNLPQALVNFLVHEFYLNNRLLSNNTLRILDTPIDLQKITIPAYFFAAELDHLVPWRSAYAGVHLQGGDTTFVLGGSGHIAGTINPPSRDKYYYFTSDEKYLSGDEFLLHAQKHLGSWWTHWESWLAAQNDVQVAARDIHFGLEDAPGSYVLVRSV